MTHEKGVDDGDLEIEEWEKADAELAADGWGEEARLLFWLVMRSPDQVQHQMLIGSVMETQGCSEAEAHRLLHELNGVTL